MTLAELGAEVGRAPSVLSLIENGRREPKLSLIE
jgi:XRE family transcriptional regulator, fatty acid utilization regulator